MGKILHDAYHKEGRRGIKKHGDGDKIDYSTCTWCFEPPSSYQSVESLSKGAVFPEIV